MCICLWPEFDCPEVTLCGWQDIKIQLLLLLGCGLHYLGTSCLWFNFSSSFLMWLTGHYAPTNKSSFLCTTHQCLSLTLEILSGYTMQSELCQHIKISLTVCDRIVHWIKVWFRLWLGHTHRLTVAQQPQWKSWWKARTSLAVTHCYQSQMNMCHMAATVQVFCMDFLFVLTFRQPGAVKAISNPKPVSP